MVTGILLGATGRSLKTFSHCAGILITCSVNSCNGWSSEKRLLILSSISQNKALENMKGSYLRL